MIKTLIELRGISKSFDVDLIHAFDSLSFLWARITSIQLKVNCVLTKCGGKNQKYFPVAQNLILYSNM